jgi:hypothetical protein
VKGTFRTSVILTAFDCIICVSSASGSGIFIHLPLIVIGNVIFKSYCFLHVHCSSRIRAKTFKPCSSTVMTS